MEHETVQEALERGREKLRVLREANRDQSEKQQQEQEQQQQESK